jgi:alpha-beta hydrolase superfamily lysophospholipase
MPVLIMSGEMDPITPPAWARRAAETLENAWLFEYPGLAHGVSAASGCPQQMMTAFLEDPTQPPSSDCIHEFANP